MSELAGIDVAWAKPDPAATYRAGYRFVIGYLSPNLAKVVDAAHLSAFRCAGLAVGLVFESTADRALGGAAAGAADGALAEAQANAAGYPLDAALFAAVDFAASPAQIAGPIAAYLAAFDTATRRPVGVYGSHDVVEALVTPGVRPVRYGWQTAAWSGGQLSAKAAIYQRNTHTWPGIAGFDTAAFDEDVVTGPVPLAGGTLTPPGARPAPLPAPASPPVKPAPAAVPAGGVADTFRPAKGQTSPGIARLQAFLARFAPSYAGGLPATGFYGDLTVAAVAEFAHRSGIPSADGSNVGPLIAAALARAGFRP